MFLIKKIFSPLLNPLTLCIVLLIWGLCLLWFTRRQRSGRLLVSAGVLLLILFSYSAIPDLLLAPLERIYPPMTENRIAEIALSRQPIRWIVVLGGSHVSDPGLPLPSQISFTSLGRLTEAVRIYRRLPGTKLVLSGGAPADPVSEAEIYFKTARIMDVPTKDLIKAEPARDTEEEARIIRKIVGKAPFILVTSAVHMPRAAALFKAQGMSPLPAPAAHLFKQRSENMPEDFYPKAEELWKAQAAVHEYLGFLWHKLRKQI